MRQNITTWGSSSLGGPVTLRFSLQSVSCRTTLKPGAALSVSSDAKFGGPLHVEAMPDQQQVVSLSHAEPC